jgi:hypothetical protein
MNRKPRTHDVYDEFTLGLHYIQQLAKLIGDRAAEDGPIDSLAHAIENECALTLANAAQLRTRTGAGTRS